jgi:hypothetical protein
MKTKADFRRMNPDAIRAAMNEAERRVYGRLCEAAPRSAPPVLSGSELAAIQIREHAARVRAERAAR